MAALCGFAPLHEGWLHFSQAAKAQRKSTRFEGAWGDERFMFTGHQVDGESRLYSTPCLVDMFLLN